MGSMKPDRLDGQYQAVDERDHFLDGRLRNIAGEQTVVAGSRASARGSQSREEFAAVLPIGILRPIGKERLETGAITGLL